MPGGLVPPVRAALHNRYVRRALTAYSSSVTAEWALWVVVLVYAFERGGSSFAGFAALGLLVPAALAAPFAGAAADGLRPHRSLATVYGVQTTALSCAAAGAAADLPIALVVAMAAVSITAITFIRPSYAMILPGLVTSASELSAVQLLSGYIDGAGVLVGPLVASAAFALEGGATGFAVCAVLSLCGLVSILPLVALDADLEVHLEFDDAEAAPDVHAPHVVPEHEHRSASGTLWAHAKLLAERPGSLSLLAVITGEFVLTGAVDLLFVVLAVDLLHLGSSGPGYLSAAYGVGALLGGLLSTLLVGRRRLAPVLLVTMLGLAGAMAVISGITTLTTVLLLVPVIGVAHSLLDLTGRILLQRSAPAEALASVFALLEVLIGVGTAIGSILAQVVLATLGARAAILAVGIFFLLLATATGTRLRHVDGGTAPPIVAIHLLRSMSIFAPLPAPALEGVARAAEEVHIRAGEVVIAEGGTGDQYYAVVAGDVEVTMNGTFIRTMHRGQGFGEIALLADVPRTATVTARTDVSLLSIERAAFLTAVTGHDASERTAWSVARAFHPALDPESDAPPQ